MTRPSFDSLYLDLARGLSTRSTCKRLSVGCVIASLDGRRVYGVGYNGGAAGLHDECTDAIGNCGCVHAEANAIANAETRRSDDKVILVTTSPCLLCAKLIVNLGGVKRVRWLASYRLTDGADLLVRAGIDAKEWTL